MKKLDAVHELDPVSVVFTAPAAFWKDLTRVVSEVELALKLERDALPDKSSKHCKDIHKQSCVLDSLRLVLNDTFRTGSGERVACKARLLED